MVAAAALNVLGPSAPAVAGEVLLRVKGGGLEVSGELKSFDGTTYVIEAPSVGEMSFDASRFECVGDNCTRRITSSVLPPEPLDPASPGKLAIEGSSSATRELVPALIRGYAQSIGAGTESIIGTTPGQSRFRIADASGAELATIAVAGGGAAEAFSSLRDGKAAIGMSDRPITAAEVAFLTHLAPDMRSSQTQHVVGQDGLAVIVPAENPLSAIPEDMLVKMFSGEVTTWSEAGVPGGKIAIYRASKASSAGEVLVATMLQGKSPAPAVKELETESDVADAVARDPNGIGVVSFALARSAKRLNIEGGCGLITRPTSFNVKAGEYTLSRQLFFYTGGFLDVPAARGFLRYALSRDAQETIAGLDFVDERIEALSFDEQPERMAYALNMSGQGFDMAEMKKLIADLKGARRLSLTFRFTGGQAELAPQSRLDLLRLVEYMQSPEGVGKTVMLVGFTDNDGRFSANESVSLRRAGQVKSALLQAAGGKVLQSAVVAKGYGPLAPVACHDGPRRALNRRVEVWVK
jgi:phosphate transport system substrate-binding protein